MNSNKEMTKNQ